MKSLRKTWNLFVLWDWEHLLWPLLWPWPFNPLKVYVHYLQCGWSSCVMVSLSHLQRLCHWIFGRVLEYSYSWTGRLWHFGRKMYEKVFAFSLVHCVKGLLPQTLESFKPCFSCCLWLTVWLLWTAAGDTIGLFRSSSCISGRDIAHTGRVWCWSPLDLHVTLELVCS